MLLDTTLSDDDRYPLKLRNLIVFDTPVDMAPAAIGWGTAERLPYDTPGFTGDFLHGPAFADSPYEAFNSKLMYIDPAGAGSDQVGYCIVGYREGMIYVLDAGGFDGTGLSDAVMVKLSKLAQLYEIKRVIVESNWGGSKGESAYAKLLQVPMAKWAQAGVEALLSKGQKEVRILDVLEPLVANHRIVISHTVAKKTELLYQMTHMTRNRGALAHDDQIEAMCGACAQYVEAMSLDPEQRVADRHVQASIDAAKEFERDWKRVNPGKDPWAKTKSLTRGKRWKRC
jgi:predicted phage terminase large subunit-like protein